MITLICGIYKKQKKQNKNKFIDRTADGYQRGRDWGGGSELGEGMVMDGN